MKSCNLVWSNIDIEEIFATYLNSNTKDLQTYQPPGTMFVLLDTSSRQTIA